MAIIAKSRAVIIQILITLIRAYQLVISPLIGPSCRFQPTCSHYAIEAIKEHGAFFGVWLALKRIMRCHPMGGSGYDPVPKITTHKSNATNDARPSYFVSSHQKSPFPHE